MQTAAKSQPFVKFLLILGVDEDAAMAVANKQQNLETILPRLYLWIRRSSHGEVGDDISAELNLPKALEGEQLEDTKYILADYFLGTRASISDGLKNPPVLEFRRELLKYAWKFLDGRESLFFDDIVLQCGVTLADLISAKATPDGVMSVFPEQLRALILAGIPKAPALLENVLAEVESARAASRKRGRDEDTDGPDGNTASADHEEASGQTTPPPTKMSKLELFRLNCAPLKMPRFGYT